MHEHAYMCTHKCTQKHMHGNSHTRAWTYLLIRAHTALINIGRCTLLYSQTHTSIHICTYTQTYTDTGVLSHTQLRKCTYRKTRTRTHTCTHSHFNIYINNCTYMCRLDHALTYSFFVSLSLSLYTHAHAHTCLRTYTLSHIYTIIYIYTRTDSIMHSYSLRHSHINTHTHTYTLKHHTTHSRPQYRLPHFVVSARNSLE